MLGAQPQDATILADRFMQTASSLLRAAISVELFYQLCERATQFNVNARG